VADDLFKQDYDSGHRELFSRSKDGDISPLAEEMIKTLIPNLSNSLTQVRAVCLQLGLPFQSDSRSCSCSRWFLSPKQSTSAPLCTRCFSPPCKWTRHQGYRKEYKELVTTFSFPFLCSSTARKALIPPFAVAEGTRKTLQATVPKALERTLPPLLLKPVHDTLTRVLTRCATHILAPALTFSLSHSAAEHVSCAYCR